MYGRVVAVTPIPLGDELAVAAVVGASVLQVDDVADFSESGGWLDISGTRYQYVSVDDDASTITLASTLSDAVDEGTAINVWDPQASGGTGAVAVVYEADVETDDDGVTGDPLQATVDHTLAPLLADAIRSEGSETVELAWDGDDLRVVNVLGKEAEVVGTTVTGSVVQTAYPPDARVELSQNPSFPYGAAGGINMYTGDDGAWDPAMLYNQELSGAGLPGWYAVTLTAAKVKALAPDSPRIRLYQGPDGSHQIQIMSKTVNVVPPTNSPAGTVSSFGVTGAANVSGELHGDTVWVDSLPTTANAANVNMSVNGQLRQSTSSKRYKDDIQDADLDLDAYLALRQVSWVSKNPDDGTGRFVGRIAEEVADAGLEPLLVRDDAGRPNAVAYPVEVVYLQALAQRQQAQIDDLTARLDALEAKES